MFPEATVPSAGATKDLLDKFSVPARVARVPVVGSVTVVVPVTVRVVANAPESVTAPPTTTALPPTVKVVAVRAETATVEEDSCKAVLPPRPSCTVCKDPVIPVRSTTS